MERATDESIPPRTPGAPPLWPGVALTWINNLGAAAALMGIYFVAKHAYGFGPFESLSLGLLQGVTYVASALSVGRVSPWLAGPGRMLSTRGLLAIVTAVMGLLCMLPILAQGSWAVWTLVGAYSAASGWLWPIIESFISGGRHGADLRKATGRFNVSWASSQVVTFWIMAWFMESHPVASIAVLGLSHFVCLALLAWLPREPASHDDHGIEPLSTVQRERYRSLLTAHRFLLILSYVVYSALSPLLPTIMGRLELPPAAETRWASVWMVSRVLMFLLMERWHGWHGKPSTLLWSGTVLVTGFGVCMLAPSVPVLVLGLALFGVGAGAVYAAAFYYAMAVGSAGIEAGGKHEALIGVGYSTGPAAGLGAGVLVTQEIIARTQLEQATLAIVGGVGAIVAFGVVRAVTRLSRSDRLDQ